jgi:hypothetical protein
MAAQVFALGFLVDCRKYLFKTPDLVLGFSFVLFERGPELLGQGHALAGAPCRECRALNDRSWRLGRALVGAVLKLRLACRA